MIRETKSPQPSTSNSDYPTVNVCDICGNVGKPGTIFPCSKCKINSEHYYCRKILTESKFDEWYCDDCEKETTASPKLYDEDTCSKLSGKSWGKEKIVTAGKVKYIPSEEAITLSSRPERGKFPVKTRRVVKPTRPKPPIYRQRSQISQVSKGNQSVRFVEPLATALKETSVPSKALCAPSQRKKLLPPISPDHRVSETENSVVGMDCKAKIFSRGPALNSSWRGRFEIHSGMPKNFNSWFQAHPRFKVKTKVVEFSSRMPDVLRFKLFPRKKILTELFQDDCPKEDDIGLYFFSGGNKRSSDYDSILTFIERYDMAMRCDIHGVELFLFSSKVLFADSQKLDADCFLWGIFRKIRKA